METVVIIFLIASFFQGLFLTVFLMAFIKSPTFSFVPAVPVSVVVCAHNEEKNLKLLVPLLLQQDYPHFEVVVVEDRSNDKTFGYLSKVAKQDSRLKIVRVSHRPEHINAKKFALTLGIKATANEWIVLTDADCQPNNNQWLGAMSRHFTTKAQIVLGYSPYRKSKGLLNSFIRYEGLLTGIKYMGIAFLGRPYMGVGRNLAYRKSFFMEKKGFSSHCWVTGGDDDLFVNEHGSRKNVLCSVGRNAIMYSNPKTSWRAFYFQKLRHLSVGKHYKLLDKFILGLFSSSLLLSWFLFIPSWLHFPEGRPVVEGVFLVRCTLLIGLVYIASRKLGASFEAWKVPFLDFIFAFYYPIIGFMALQTKKIQWNEP